MAKPVNIPVWGSQAPRPKPAKAKETATPPPAPEREGKLRVVVGRKPPGQEKIGTIAGKWTGGETKE